MHIKPEEMKHVERFKAMHPYGRLLSEMKNWGFQVGDTLVRYKINRDNGQLILDLISPTCPVPKKFRVVYIDDLGIPWVKQLSVRGGLGNCLYCLAQHDIYVFRYKVDPEQIEASLLGYRYDPRIEYRRMRQNNPEYGKCSTK